MKKRVRIDTLNTGSGFFSDFLTIFAGIMYCIENDYEYDIKWNNNLYGDNNINLFDLFFKQKKFDSNEYDFYFNRLTPKGFYFTENINFNQNHQYFNLLEKPSLLLKESKILDSNFINNIDFDQIKNKKVLGVHKRGTDHLQHGIILSDEFFLEKINEKFKNENFDKILVITDDVRSYNFFNKELGDQAIFTDSLKTDSTMGLHKSLLYDKYKLACDVLRDALWLANTDFKLITKSNVSTFSLLCNLNLYNFDYVDTNIIYQ